MTRPLMLTALLLGAAAMPALAEEAEIRQPVEAARLHEGEAASLHEGALDMVAYYTELDSGAYEGAYEVVATFAEKSGESPARVRLAMQEGDALQFSMPGDRGTLYGFARDNGTLSITAEPAPIAAAEALRPAARDI
jgi:hypothetical protein